MPQERSTEGARWRFAIGIQATGIFGKPLVSEFQRPGAREGKSIPAVSSWHHAIEHVDSVLDAFEQILGPADAHKVPWLFRREYRYGFGEDLVHDFDRFADTQSSDSVAREIELD